MANFIEYKNFNGIGFVLNNKYYIFSNYSNHILKTDELVFSIIDDSFVIENKEIIAKNRNSFPESKISEALKNISKLKKKGILSNFKFKRLSIDSTAQNLPIIKEVLDKKLSVLILNVTENCNLRCKYCIYSGSYKNRRKHNNINDMPISIAKKSVDFFVKHNKESSSKQISFYGGEPLLRFEFIKEVIEYAKKIDREIKFNITTNGTLLNENIIEYLNGVNIRYLTISIDGPKEIHDSNRQFVNGFGTFDVLFEKIQMIKEKFSDFYMNKLKFNAVIVPFDNDFNTIPNFFNIENFSFLTDISKLSFGEINPSENDYVNNTKYINFLNDYYPYIRESYKRNILKGEDFSRFLVQRNFLFRRLNTIHLRSHKCLSDFSYYWPNSICIPGSRSLFVNSDGEFYPCEKLSDYQDMKIGTIHKGFYYNKITSYIYEYCNKIQEKCSRCWVYRMCGECFLSIRENRRFNLKKRNMYCDFQKKNFYNYLKLYIEIRESDKYALDYLIEEEKAFQIRDEYNNKYIEDS